MNLRKSRTIAFYIPSFAFVNDFLTQDINCIIFEDIFF